MQIFSCNLILEGAAPIKYYLEAADIMQANAIINSKFPRAVFKGPVTMDSNTIKLNRFVCSIILPNASPIQYTVEAQDVLQATAIIKSQFPKVSYMGPVTLA